MGAEVKTQSLAIRGYGDGVAEGTAEVIVYDRVARWVRAFQGLGLAWAVAAITVFIPLAHFLLVPGFGLFGIVVFVKRIRAPAVATVVKGTCPDCSLEQSFDLGGPWRLPRTLNCTGCRRALEARAS